MKATCSSDTWEAFYETARRHMPEDRNIQRPVIRTWNLFQSEKRLDCSVWTQSVSEWVGLRPYMGVATPGAVPTLIPNFPCRSTDWLLRWFVGVPRRIGVESGVGLERSDVGVGL
jgi:hypothetical protein